jgi:hypothetical protein
MEKPETRVATPAGPASGDAKRQLRLYGTNSLVQESRFAALIDFLLLFANPLFVIARHADR